MKKLFLILLCACGAARAQHGMMPDGSSDMYFGLSLRSTTPYANGEARQTVLRPLWQVEWSNGIFISDFNTVGWHLSNRPDLEYGPFIANRTARHPGDSPRLAGTQPTNGTPNVGGFFNYYLGEGFRLRSATAYDSSAHGLVFSMDLQRTWGDLAPHHTVTLTAGLAAASGVVMRQQYSVRREAGVDYQPSGGVLNLNAGVNWNWVLSRSWILNTAATGTRLGTSPANSPIVGRTNFLTWSTGLAYRY